MAEEKNNQNIQEPQLDKSVDIDQPGTDSVTEDINKFKTSFKKFTEGVHQKAKPMAQKVQQKVVEKTPAAVKEKIVKKAGTGWVKFIFVPVFIIFVALIMFTLAKKTTENGGEDPSATPTGVWEPTPTLEPFRPVRESVYADDPEVQKLQEELNVINNEMFSVPLRDTTLNSPILDFNIVFND